MMERGELLRRIQQNIVDFGYHLTTVTSNTEPRYIYSIGLNEKFGYELIFAGGIIFLQEDLSIIFSEIYNQLGNGEPTSEQVYKTSLGNFTLQSVHESWAKLTGLGAFDYYGKNDIKFLQLLPDKEHYTLDIPIMSVDFVKANNAIWKYLNSEWDISVPETSTVVTNIGVLRGEPVSELMRWEEDEWEMFSIPGPDVDENEMRVLSIATLTGIDPTLSVSLGIEVGKGLWRKDLDSEWNQ